MALKMNIGSNIDQVVQSLDELHRRQLPYALTLAMNNTVKYALPRLKRHAKLSIDRVRPSTVKNLKPWYVKKPAVVRGKGTAAIFVTKALEDSLLPTIEGGTVYEQNDVRGVVSPVNIKINQYGNIAALRGKLSRLRKNTTRYLIVELGEEQEYNGLHAGVYEYYKDSSGNRLHMLMAFYESQDYEVTWPADKFMRKLYGKRFPIELDAAMAKALRTAR